MTDWWALDPGLKNLLLVGPMQQERLTPELLRHTDLADIPQVAIDGGSRTAHDPVLWAGDGDSGLAPTGVAIQHKETQDKTDLGFCLDGIRNWRWRELHLAGFLGGRTDHLLANFGEIHAELGRRRKMHKAVFYNAALNPEITFYPDGNHTLVLKGLFSVLVLEPSVLDLSGDCKYPVNGLALEKLSGQGVSNEAHGEVIIRCDHPFALVTPGHTHA